MKNKGNVIKLIYIINSLDIGGTEKHVSDLASRLEQDKFSIAVFCFNRRGKLSSELNEHVRVYISPAAEKFYGTGMAGEVLSLLGSIIYLVYLLSKLKPDIVHFFLPKPYILGSVCSFIAGGNIRIYSRRSLNDYSRNHPFLFRLEKYLHRYMNAVLGNAQAVMNQLLEEGVSKDKCAVIYNGIEPADDNFEARDGLTNIEHDGQLQFIIISNLIPYKGHEDLFRALAGVEKQIICDWKLLVAGRDEGYGEKLSHLVDELNLTSHVHFLGEVSDVNTYLNEAHIGIQCSHQEGFSNSILELMAASIPVIATDVGGNPEAVIDGETGLVVPPNDPLALGHAILSLANDPALRKTLGSNARVRVLQEFSMQECLQKYTALYQGLVLGNAPTVSELIEYNSRHAACAE